MIALLLKIRVGRVALFSVRATATCATFEIIAPQHHRGVFSAKLAPPRHCTSAPHLRGKIAQLSRIFNKILGLNFFTTVNVPVVSSFLKFRYF